MIDYFDADLEIKSVSVSQRLISGWAAHHHSIDRVRDIVDPAASAKAVKRLKSPTDVGVFIGHRSDSLPIGVPQKIEAAPQGLYTETYILKGHAGDNLLAVAKDLQEHGLSLGMSIGYKTHDSKMEQTAHGRVRRLLDYTLAEFSYAASQAIANPSALVTAIKSRSRRHGLELSVKGVGMQYRVEHDLQSDRWLVYCDADADGDEDDNVLVGTYESQEIANAVATALRMPQRADDDGAGDTAGNGDKTEMGGKTQEPGAQTPQQEWSSAQIQALPDCCFLYVEPGDKEEGKTVPAAKRHFAYRASADAAPDTAALRRVLAALPDATAEGLDDARKAQLGARARRMLELAEAGKTADEPAEWKTGAPLEVCGLGYRLVDLSEQLASELKAMVLLGDEVKGYRRIRAPLRSEIAAVVKDLGQLLEFAEACERGEDGQQRLAYLRQQLALTEV